jgi:hypothetical protein
MAVAPSHTQFSITLPDEIIALMKLLERDKLYGSNRGEVARALILDALKNLKAQGAFPK